MKNPLFDATGQLNFAAAAKHPEECIKAMDQVLADARVSLDQATHATEVPDMNNLIAPLENYRRDSETVQNIALFFSLDIFSTPEMANGICEKSIGNSVDAFSKQPLVPEPRHGRTFERTRCRQGDHLPLTADDLGILRYYRLQFEAAGACPQIMNATGAADRLRDINKKLIKASGTFNTNLKDDIVRQSIHVTDEAEMAGLENYKDGFAANAAESNLTGYLIPANRQNMEQFLKFASHPNMQAQLYQTRLSLAQNKTCDSRPVIEEMRALRQEYADLLEYPDYAHYAAARTATGDLEKIDTILKEVEQRLLPAFEKEMQELETFAGTKLTPVNVFYWANEQKKALCGFDEAAFSEYLDVNAVLSGVATAMSEPFDVDCQAAPTGAYGTDAKASRVFDILHRPTGNRAVLLIDLYSRPGKRSGGWQEPVSAADDDGHPPVFTLCLNMPAPGQPAKMPLSDYRTIWHEFGHMMNCVLGQKTTWPSHRNIENGPSDRAEVHSTMNEHRGFEREMIKSIARKDGMPPDDVLLDKMAAAENHLPAWETLRLLQNARNDLALHMGDPSTHKLRYPTIKDAEDATRLKSPNAALLRPIPIPSFTHPFMFPHSPYAARYNSYLLAKINSDAAWQPFAEHGPERSCLAEADAGSPVRFGRRRQ